MTVRLNEVEHTFTFDEFEPVILNPEEAGKIEVREVELDQDAGLMPKPLVEDMSGYSLKEYFRTQGMKVGTCINPSYLFAPYAEILKSQFSSVTLENHLKPDVILNQEKSKVLGRVCVSFPEETSHLLDWCAENDIPVRGHTMVWYMGTPEWLFHENFDADAPNVSRSELLRRMEDYIAAFFAELTKGGWADNMYCVDVVNEAVIAPDKMRKCPWQEIIGDEYVKYAFSFARKYAPDHILLAYNDFDLETKTDKVIELMNSLTDEKGDRLVDVVGQQGHYGAYSSIETLGSALTKIYEQTGCEIQITELDVSVSRQGTDEELKTQGRFYYNFVQEILGLRKNGVKITGITLWGFADALSWMPSGHLHIYDRRLVPKYAYFGMIGLREYAGFDGEEKFAAEGRTNASYTVPGEPARYILLRDDGTYADTVHGSETVGKYRFDGRSAYMLTPRAGGYCSLEIDSGGLTARRIEAAGEVISLIREDVSTD